MVSLLIIELDESLKAIKEYKKQYRIELALSKMIAKKEASEQDQSQPEA